MTIAYYQYFQYASLILAIMFYRSLKTRSLGLLLPLLIIVCVVETAAHSTKALGLKTNYDIYKVWTVGSLLLHYVIFAKLLKMKNWQLFLYLAICSVTIGFMLIDLIFISPGTTVYYTNTLMCIEQFLLSCLLIGQLFMDDSNPVQLSAHPHFWFAAGLMVFTACYMIISGLHPYLRDNKITLFGDPIYRTVGRLINYVLYICYSISIILCSRYKQMSPLSS
jgi:hypothetical protein